MKDIKDLLERFKNIRSPLEDKNIVSNIIKNQTGIEIDTSDIKFNSNIIKLNINSTYKGEIYMKKNQILDEIKKEIPSSFFKNLI